MLKRLKSLENNFSVSRAAIIVGCFTLLAKLVALARDSLLAGKIGPGDTLDIYYAAFRIPDFIFNLLVLGTLSVAFIPVFTEWLVKDRAKAYRIANSVLNFAFLAMAFCCLILLLFSVPLTKALVPGFTGDKFTQTVSLVRLFLLSPIIFTVSSVFSSILSSYKKFLITSLAPILYNLGIIFGLFFLYPKFGVMGLGYGVILGAILHLLVQIPEVMRYGFTWSPIIDFHEPVLKKIGKLFLPRIIGMDNSQISLLVATTVGSILASGSVTIFNFANNLEAVPLSIFALSVSAASFPLLSEQFAQKDNAGFVKTLGSNVMQVLFFIIPLAILMIIFRTYIVRLVLGHGNFNWDDTRTTFTTLGILAFSLLGQSLSPLFSRSFYARQNTIIPVMVNITAIVLNAVLAVVLGKSHGLYGIAIALSISCTVDALLMFIFLRIKLVKDGVSLAGFDKDLFVFIFKILAASVVMGLVARAGIYTIAPFVDTKTNLGIVLQAGISGLLAVASFIYISYKIGLSQAKGLVEFLGRLM